MVKILIDSEHIDTLIITDTPKGIEAKCSGDSCWVCESTSQITLHHTIPLHLYPKKNVIVPVCLPCHKKINEADLTGIKAFGHKLSMKMGEIKHELGVWIHNSNQIFARHK